MSKVWMWSDLHLGHDNAINWRKEFKTAEEHHETLFDNLATAVGKRDVLYLLGDIAMSTEWLTRVCSIPCVKRIAVLGNHDTEKRGGVEGYHLAAQFDEIHSLMKYRTSRGLPNIWLSHAPIHEQELRGCINIHGHTHDHNITRKGRKPTWYGSKVVDVLDKRYVNICPEQTDWKPVNFQQLLQKLREEKLL